MAKRPKDPNIYHNATTESQRSLNKWHLNVTQMTQMPPNGNQMNPKGHQNDPINTQMVAYHAKETQNR